MTAAHSTPETRDNPPSAVPPAQLAALKLPTPLPPDPMPLLALWLDEARAAAAAPNPDAMILATCTPDARPSARVVLCKGIDIANARIIFYTNYESRKASELDANPRAAAVFHWDHLGRQARIEGTVTRSPAEESDAYFATRPLLSQLGAWASQQSRPLDSRFKLLERLGSAMARFNIGTGEDLATSRIRVPRPAYWGGYRIHIDTVELWTGADYRLHDRAVWVRQPADAGAPASETGAPDKAPPPTCTWTATRRQP